MWMLISSVLLATLLVSGLSLAHPDKGKYKIPDVGTGRRAQYYVLHRDGTFKYGFDTGDGAYEEVKSMVVGAQQGEFGYTDPEGKKIKLEYESGKGGFVARGDHLPKVTYQDSVAEIIRRSKPFVDPLANSGSDASYNFGFKSDSHSRNEESDPNGRVTGSYNYIDENGALRKFNYQAGRGIGFQISGDGLTTPDQPARRSGAAFRSSTKTKQTVPKSYQTPFVGTRTTHQHSGIKTTRRQQFPRQYKDAIVQTVTGDNGEYSFSYDTGTHSRSESGDQKLNVVGNFEFEVPEDSITRRLQYEAGPDTGFIVSADHLPVGPSVPGAEDGKPSGQFVRLRTREFVDPLATSDSDSSYKFGFDSDSYSRSETSDKDGNVAGSYTVVEEDGTRVTTVFRAGKGIGFEITDVSRVPGTPVITSFRSKHQETKPISTGSISTQNKHASSSSFRSSFQPREYKDANIQTYSGDDGAYSFSYKTDTHSRSESGDKDNNVVGRFAFIAADDGVERKLEYEAGRDTGFIVSADHLPVGPSVPGAEDGTPSGQFARYQKSDFVDPLASTDSDSSYNFGFESDTYSRSETADKDGNIVGTYTIVEEDGTKVKSEFRAGKGIGYEIKEISRVKGVPPPKATFRRTQHTSYKQPAQKTSVSQQSSFRSIPRTQSSFHPSNIISTTGENGEYSFSYNTDTHHRAESGDSDNTVVGEFSFIADDGINRKLEYEAGRETGFIVNAGHLPVGPSVPGAEDGKPSGQFVRFQKSEFEDPLASSIESDSSYKFNFDTDSYSRSEQSDKDGNIVGTFSITDDTGTKVTNEFRAGKGIGYEVEEVSRVQVAAPSRSATFRKISNKVSQPTKFATIPTHGRVSHNQNIQGAKRTSSFSGRRQSISADTRSRQSFPTVQRKSHRVTSSDHTKHGMVKSGHIPGSTVIVSPEYSIHQYTASPKSNKFGYVIKYN